MQSKGILLYMKALPCIPLLVATFAWADTTADRAAIERIVGAVIADQTRPGAKLSSTLFTADADSEFDRLLDLDRRLLELSKEPWSEVTGPRMVIQSIRFVTPEVALVNAANTHYGSNDLGAADSGAVCNEKGRHRLAHSVPPGAGGCSEFALTLRQEPRKGPRWRSDRGTPVEHQF